MNRHAWVTSGCEEPVTCWTEYAIDINDSIQQVTGVKSSDMDTFIGRLA